MERKAVSDLMLRLFLIVMLCVAFSLSPAKAVEVSDYREIHEASGSSDSWVWVRDTITGAWGEAVVGTGDAIYIGRKLSFYRYRPADNSWTVLAAPPNPDAGDAFKTGTALSWDFGDYIYALYGAATADSRRWFYRYSISGNSWQALANTPYDQGEGDAITWVGLDNRIYATIGGEQRATYFLRYDPSTNTWSDAEVADPPAGMGDGASLVWIGGELLYALRGEFYEESPTYDFWRYSITSDIWTAMADIPASPHNGGVGGVGDGGSLLYIGLWLSNQTDFIYALSGNQAYPESPSPLPDNRFYRYAISTDSWERLADLPFGVGYYVGCRLGYADGHIYAWQGAPSTWTGGGDDLARYEFPPQVGKTVTIKPIADTYVDEKYHWENNGHEDILAVWAYGDKYISFIKFDLSTIPSSADIISAELFLRVVEHSVNSNDPSIIGAHFYSNNSWGEYDLAWNTVDWSALKETATDTTEIYVDKLEYQVWFNWTIAEDVESARGDFLTVVLMAENEIESIFFYSRETSLSPYLNVTYSAHPVACFTYSPQFPFEGETVTFNASCSAPNGEIVNYWWDFGDETTTIITSPVVNHVYTSPGSYNVNLTVTNEFELTNSTTKPLSVHSDNIPPTTIDNYEGLWHVTDFTIILTATDYESGVAETYYRLNESPIKSVSLEGYPYIVIEGANNTLEYWSVDNAGNEETHHVLTGIKLDKTQPTASAGANQTVAEDTLVTFNGSASWDENGIVSYTWTFTDITPQTLSGENPTYNFTTPGTYIITLTVEDVAGNNATDTVTITVLLDTAQPSPWWILGATAAVIIGIAVVATFLWRRRK